MTARPRLVIDGRRLGAGRTGVGRYLETLLRAWSRTGPPIGEVVVALADRDPGRVGALPEVTGLRYEPVGVGLPGLAWETVGLGRLLRRGDALFAPTNLIPTVWRGPTALVAFDTLLESAPDGFSRAVRWRFRSRYRSAARRATLVIVPSEATARDVARHHRVEPDRLRVIPPGVGPDFRPRPADDPVVIAARRTVGLGPTARYALFVGKRSRRRNVPLVLDGFALHRERFPDDRLVFVGPDRAGPDPDLDGRAGLIRAGHVPDEALHGLLSGAFACLYPSEYEGFGLPVIEALASGCPVVTLRNSALIESGGDAAVYLDDRRPETLAAALGKLRDDSASRRDRVARGLAHAARFRGTRFAEAIGAAIREVSALAPAGGRG